MEKKKTKSQSQKKQLHEEMETLFMFAPPRQLKKSLHEVYAFYLKNLNVTMVNPDFNNMAMDFYFLHHFLEKAEELEKKMPEP